MTEEQPFAEPSAPEAPPEAPQELTPQQLHEKVQSLEKLAQQALAAAERAQGDARRAQSTADARAKQLSREVVAARQELANYVMQGMTPEDQRIFRLEQANAALQQQGQAADSIGSQDAFRQWAGGVLAQQGIQSNDPVLMRSFQQYIADSHDPAVWQAALGMAVADVRTAQAKEASAKADERVKLAREEERAKAVKEGRSAQGRVDRGQPVARTGGKNPLEMSDEEFAAFEKEKDASVGRVTPPIR